MEDLLHQFPVRIELPVAWGDMDAFGHVNNVVYFRYFESARIRYLERIGYRDLTRECGSGPILASASCRFKQALHYPDTVVVGARIACLGEDRFDMAYRLVSRALESVAAEGTGLVVWFDYRKQRKILLPPELRQRIRELEGDLPGEPVREPS